MNSKMKELLVWQAVTTAFLAGAYFLTLYRGGNENRAITNLFCIAIAFLVPAVVVSLTESVKSTKEAAAIAGAATFASLCGVFFAAGTYGRIVEGVVIALMALILASVATIELKYRWVFLCLTVQAAIFYFSLTCGVRAVQW